jgi:hypothetical protein
MNVGGTSNKKEYEKTISSSSDSSVDLIPVEKVYNRKPKQLLARTYRNTDANLAKPMMF